MKIWKEWEDILRSQVCIMKVYIIVLGIYDVDTDLLYFRENDQPKK